MLSFPRGICLKQFHFFLVSFTVLRVKVNPLRLSYLWDHDWLVGLWGDNSRVYHVSVIEVW